VDPTPQVLKLDPENKEAFNIRGNAYCHKGDFDRAIADYDQAIRIDFDYEEAHSNHGVAQFMARNPL
jgi:lipoprotein NlpI